MKIDIEHLIKYTDYKGPKNPDDGYQIEVKYIRNHPGTNPICELKIAGTIVHLKYSTKYNGFYDHREGNLPAIIIPTGTKMWRIGDRYHRTNGPSIEFSDADYPKYCSRMKSNSKYSWHIYNEPVFETEEEYWMNILNRDACIQ